MFGRRMLERSRQFGRDRVIGFTPVPNGRINAAVTAQMALIQVREMEVSKRPLPADEAQREAWSIVAKTLPHGRMVRSYRGAAA